MVHHPIEVAAAAVDGYCRIHGKDSRECGAAQEFGSYLIGGLLLYGLYKQFEK